LSGCISVDPANQSGFTARLDKLEQANLIMTKKGKFKRAGDSSRSSTMRDRMIIEDSEEVRTTMVDTEHL